MTAEFWTTNGGDIWRMKERRVFDFTNMDTDEVVTCDVIDARFLPVTMPQIKPKSNLSAVAERKVKGPKGKTEKIKPKGKFNAKGN